MNNLSKEELKQQILNANKAYREGYPIMSDATYDSLVEKYETLCDKAEYNKFRAMLHEVEGKVKHPYIMGSLDKIKMEEPESIKKFIKKYIKTSMNVSAKVDGTSCRIHYVNGKPTSASTRGDGTFGEDHTDKLAYIKNLPKNITCKDTIDIRGELVILKDDFAKLEGFANARNACAGIINRKTWTPEEVSNLTFIAYTILGPKFTKDQQFKLLKDNNFFVTHYTTYDKDLPFDEILEKLTNDAAIEYSYDIDGLVVCDSTYCNETDYRPDACKAVKTNQLTATTRVIDIKFEGPSKDGFYIPVAILELIELGGACIQRATCHNLDYLNEKNIKYGSVVKILKSGDIIPKIIDVIDNSNSTDIEYPTECTCCGTELVRDTINFRCNNEKCTEQAVQQIAMFIKKLGVKSASNATLDNFGIHSFKDLVNFKPDKKYKSQIKLYEELSSKVFTRSEQDLLAATNFCGIGETQINKIVDFYGFDNIKSCKYQLLPAGIGDLTLEKFKETVLDNLKIVDMFINDARYNCLKSTQTVSKDKSNGQSVCFTGKLETMSRSDASKLAVQAGFEVKDAVTKGLTYLITNDDNTSSSKNKKAQQFGTKIINEKDFVKLMTACTVENDVLSL